MLETTNQEWLRFESSPYNKFNIKKKSCCYYFFFLLHKNKTLCQWVRLQAIVLSLWPGILWKGIKRTCLIYTVYLSEFIKSNDPLSLQCCILPINIYLILKRVLQVFPVSNDFSFFFSFCLFLTGTQKIRYVSLINGH